MANRRDEIKEVLLEAIKEQMRLDSIDADEDTRFDELDIGSLDAFNIFGDIEERYGIELPYEELGKISTLKDAIDAFEQFIDQTNDASG